MLRQKMKQPARLTGRAMVVLMLAGLASISSQSIASLASDSLICEKYLDRYSRKEGVPLGVLYAVGMTETGKYGKLHPNALNIEGKSYILSTRKEALEVFLKARKRGKKLIDLGCMQVNHYYHGKNFASPEAMLDPEANIEYAAKYLRQLWEQNGSWTKAVALYHASPKNKPAQKRYICSVIRNIVASGFGEWTPESRQFCSKKLSNR